MSRQDTSMDDVYAAQRTLAAKDFAKAEAKARPHLWEPGYPPRLFGIPVLTDASMTKPLAVTVVRSWRDRLCTWPWRPWQRERIVTLQVPSDEALLVKMDKTGLQLGMDGREYLVMHPDAYQQIKLSAP